MAKKHGNATHQDVDSPEYKTWIHIRRKGTCCNEWQDNYETFLLAVGRRPATARMYRRNSTKSYGPGNAEWRVLGVRQ